MPAATPNVPKSACPAGRARDRPHAVLRAPERGAARRPRLAPRRPRQRRRVPRQRARALGRARHRAQELPADYQRTAFQHPKKARKRWDDVWGCQRSAKIGVGERNSRAPAVSKNGLKIKVSISAKRLLAKRGYKPKYGARPMRREIQISIEDYLSEMLLKENFKIGTTVKVDANRNEFIFSFIEKKKSSTKKA